MMNKNSIEKSYYVKDTRGKLILLSEESLIEMIRIKSLKPSSKVFNREFNKWMKVSELVIYTDKSSFIDFNQISDSENIQFTQADIDDSSVQIIQLMETVQDAKECIYNARFEGLEKSKQVALKNNELESSLNDTLLSLNALELENKCLQQRISTLQAEKIEFIKSSTDRNPEVENTKIKAQVNLLNKEFKLIELDLKNEIKVNNKLVLQIEGLKKEAIELYERKEFHETQFNKIDKERIHFNSNIEIYKKEIEFLNHERGIIQNQFDKLLQKYESFLNSENSFKEKYVETTKKLKDLEEDHAQLKHKLLQTKNETKQQKRNMADIDNELEKRTLDNNKLSLKNEDLDSELKEYKEEIEVLKSLVAELKDVPAIPQNNHSEVIEKLIEQISQKDRSIEQLKTMKHGNEKNKSEIIKLKQNLNAKDKVIYGLKGVIKLQQENSISKQLYKEVINKLKYYQNSYTLLFNKSKEIAQKWKRAQKEILRLKNYTDTIKQAKLGHKVAGVGPTPKKIDGDIIVLKSDLKKIDSEQNIKVSQHIEDVKNIMSSNPLIEEGNVGMLFKVNSEKVWKINLNAYRDNMFNVFELKKLVSEKQIKKETKVKILGKAWTSISDSFELNAEILVKDIDGEENYFIQRETIRVPVQRLVRVNYTQDQIDCICVNVSHGGCLIEMQKLPPSIKNNDQIIVTFYKQNLEEIEVKCIIKNINDSLGVFAIGLMFDQPSIEFQEWLDLEIKDFSYQNGLELAA
jgi:hypothetical protein